MQSYPSMRRRHVLAVGLVVGLSCLSGTAEERSKSRETDKVADVPPPIASAARGEEMSPQAKEIQTWAIEFGKEITQVIESWVIGGAVTQERLFSYLYYPIPNTDPTKYTTDYDSLADRDFQAIVDKYLAKSNVLIYALATDRNGYAPTHNRQYSQPLTGNRAVDLINNRTKRMFGDQIGFRAARNTKPYLLQSYARDTGEVVADLSLPIIVRGRHWGCVRIGYRQVDRQQ